MLEYRVNKNTTDLNDIELEIENIMFTDFENLEVDDVSIDNYNGPNMGKVMVTCECKDIVKAKNGNFINAVNTLTLNYGEDTPLVQTYTFNNKFQINSVSDGNKSFSFLIDKKYYLKPSEIVRYIGNPNQYPGVDEDDRIFLYFQDVHYFDITDNFDVDEAKQEIPLHFVFFDNDGIQKDVIVTFRYFSPDCLVASFGDFDDDLYQIIFGITIEEEEDEEHGSFQYVNMVKNTDIISKKDYEELPDDDKLAYYLLFNQRYGDLGGIEIYRDNFLFGEKTTYQITLDKAIALLNIPIANTFETNLFQMELLNEYFVETERKKAINSITDLEKDIYYPCISNGNSQSPSFSDIRTIKFNLHFREHRDEDWLIDNHCFWNGVEKKNNKVSIVEINNKKLTSDNQSDLLSFLGFTNEDVHFQKNKLKKSFLRLLFFDSTNPGNQNLIHYSTIFFNTGELFSKYMRYINKEGYVSVGANRKEYGKYNPTENKIGIRVDRESFEDDTRLAAQFVVKDKHLSKSSSEGFYLYIWKDNEIPLPQDLYMKVEFNHAGYGRTIPFMMPYKKNKGGIKTFQEILNDWNNESGSDGPYDIRKYLKYSYIHLKYQYDKDNDRHIYYLDPDIYGNSVTDTSKNEIEINLYEAKVL